MKRVALAVALLAACSIDDVVVRPDPPPPRPDPAPVDAGADEPAADDVEAWCALGCANKAKLCPDASDQDGCRVTCLLYEEEAKTSPRMAWNPRCQAKAETCEATDACRGR